jgi:hypothetical protein
MKRHRLLAAFVALLAVSALVAWAYDAVAASRLSVETDHSRIATSLGNKFTLRSTVVNRDSRPATGLIAHLNAVGLDRSVYVDPEDWSSHRTHYIEIPAGGSTNITWRLQAVSAGTFDVYVVVLPRRATARPPATGPAVRVAVADRRTLNSGGIVPLALGVPALLWAARARREGPAWRLVRAGSAAQQQRRQRRRRSHRRDAF